MIPKFAKVEKTAWERIYPILQFSLLHHCLVEDLLQCEQSPRQECFCREGNTGFAPARALSISADYHVALFPRVDFSG